MRRKRRADDRVRQPSKVSATVPGNPQRIFGICRRAAALWATASRLLRRGFVLLFGGLPRFFRRPGRRGRGLGRGARLVRRGLRSRAPTLARTRFRWMPCAFSSALTASDNSLTRSLRRSTSADVWTPSLPSARDTRSSNTCSSLSQVPPAIACISLAFDMAAPRAASAVSRCGLARPGLEHFALLHQRVEHLGAAFLRFGKSAQACEPDLVRRGEHGLRKTLRLSRGFCAHCGLGFFQHGHVSSRMRSIGHCIRPT